MQVVQEGSDGEPANLPAGADAAATTARINELAAAAAANGKAVAGTLKAYDYDAAFPILVRNLIKPNPLISWFVLAAMVAAFGGEATQITKNVKTSYSRHRSGQQVTGFEELRSEPTPGGRR